MSGASKNTTAVAPFNFQDHNVRAVVRRTAASGSWPRMCATCSHHRPPPAAASLDEDERGRCIVPTPSGDQNLTTISESGLYKIIFKSRKPEAKAFTKWVTSEVLPTLRKTGSYKIPGTVESRVPEIAEVPAIAQGFMGYADLAERWGLSKEQALLSAHQSIRADYGVDLMERLALPPLKSPAQVRHLTPTELGRPYGLNARAFNYTLAYYGLQEKVDGMWKPTAAGQPYAVLVDTTKRRHNGTPVQQLRWLESVIDVLPGGWEF